MKLFLGLWIGKKVNVERYIDHEGDLYEQDGVLLGFDEIGIAIERVIDERLEIVCFPWSAVLRVEPME